VYFLPYTSSSFDFEYQLFFPLSFLSPFLLLFCTYSFFIFSIRSFSPRFFFPVSPFSSLSLFSSTFSCHSFTSLPYCFSFFVAFFLSFFRPWCFPSIHAYSCLFLSLSHVSFGNSVFHYSVFISPSIKYGIIFYIA
jgi:hypothetical protein